MRWKKRSERGQVMPLMAVILLAAGAAAVGLGRLGGAAVQRAAARTAADAAALAGAAEGRSAAEVVASSNGGRLSTYTQEGLDVEVRVTVGQAVATARARLEPGGAAPDGQPGVGTGGLTPGLVSALQRAEALLRRAIPITSGYRSPAKQAELWANRFQNPFPVARPGTSKHERGLAVDVPTSFAPTLAAVGPRVGLCHPYPEQDPVHFELC